MFEFEYGLKSQGLTMVGLASVFSQTMASSACMWFDSILSWRCAISWSRRFLTQDIFGEWV